MARKRGNNKWIQFVKKVQAEQCCTYFEAAKLAANDCDYQAQWEDFKSGKRSSSSACSSNPCSTVKRNKVNCFNQKNNFACIDQSQSLKRMSAQKWMSSAWGDCSKVPKPSKFDIFSTSCCVLPNIRRNNNGC